MRFSPLLMLAAFLPGVASAHPGHGEHSALAPFHGFELPLMGMAAIVAIFAVLKWAGKRGR